MANGNTVYVAKFNYNLPLLLIMPSHYAERVADVVIRVGGVAQRSKIMMIKVVPEAPLTVHYGTVTLYQRWLTDTISHISNYSSGVWCNWSLMVSLQRQFDYNSCFCRYSNHNSGYILIWEATVSKQSNSFLLLASSSTKPWVTNNSVWHLVCVNIKHVYSYGWDCIRLLI